MLIAVVILVVVIPVAAPFTLMEIPVPVAVPTVVMFDPAATSLPVTHKELLSVVMRSHPTSPRVRWSRPITFMPSVTPSHGIPITDYPHELGAWALRLDVNHTGRRWRANSDSDGDLSAEYRSGCH